MKAKSLKQLVEIKEICSWLPPGLDGRKVFSQEHISLITPPHRTAKQRIRCERTLTATSLLKQQNSVTSAALANEWLLSAFRHQQTTCYCHRRGQT